MVAAADAAVAVVNAAVGGGNRGFQFGRGGRGFLEPQRHAVIFRYQLADLRSLNAAPYSLTGQELTKAPYSQNTSGLLLAARW